MRRGTILRDPDWPEIGSGEVPIEAADLLLVPRGRITERGMRLNIGTALAHLGGHRDHPDEPTALRAASAARLAAAQLWQWVRHETGVLDVGRIVTPALFEALLDKELAAADDPEGLAVAARLQDRGLGTLLAHELFGRAVEIKVGDVRGDGG